MYKVIPYVLFDRRAFRDTVDHDCEEYLDLARARAWGFEVRNNTDQDVVMALIGGPGAGPVGATATVAAGATEPIATDIWLPRLGLRATFGIAPAAGALNVVGWTQVDTEQV